MSSLSDILTAAKNIVTAINNAAQSYTNVQGAQSLAGITSATVVKAAAGRVVVVSVVVAGSGAGAIYDANGASVRAMLERLGVTPIDLGIVGDDPARLEAALHDASLYADAVVTSGGVGLGDADHTRVLLARLGDVVAWNLAIRPGRPMVFGQLHRPAADATRLSCALFGLPGNPVAAMVSFYVFVRPALLRLQGAQARPLPRLRVRCTERLRKRAGRTEFQRGILHTDSAGEPAVRSTGPQGSGVLRSMTQANCLIVLPDAQGDVAPGDWVEVMLFEGLV